MSNVKILDCTLRDGGYINEWMFGKEAIEGIVSNLESANIDIIEIGFLRNKEYSEDCTVFSSIEQINSLILPKKSNTLYAVMVEQHNYDERFFPEYDDTFVDLVRLTFRKDEWKTAKNTVSSLIKKGYRVCVQPVGTSTYDEGHLLNMIKEVNEINPYAFYIVDTLGMMYNNDMSKIFKLIDDNLSQNIFIGFHSHNNLQMAFSNAQEMISLNKNRVIIVDSSCYGMGRGVGNLTTELIADYINKNIKQRYSLIPILKIVDKYLMPVYAEYRWGYDLPYFLSAIVMCHPNYATYLIKKETLGIENIEKILNLIPEDSRSEYDANLIEELYLQMQNYDIDDSQSFCEIKTLVKEKEVVILGSGSSIYVYKNSIKEQIENKIIISVNFIPAEYSVDAIFISNEKRLDKLDLNSVSRVFATSNLKEKDLTAVFFNYSSMLGEGEELDNAGAMLIKILKKANVKKLYIAGFDGFDVDSSVNYVVSTYRKPIDYYTMKKKNESISKQLKLALDGMDYELLTPTKYEISCF